MIFKKLILHNFRQYKGTNEISFSTNKTKNVTVIHGENGSGKTAILNAFNWVLYGVTDLPDGKKLINHYAINEIETTYPEMFVELHFETREIDYILKRSVVFENGRYNLSDGREEVSLVYFDNGKWNSLRNYSTQINQLLPENLRSYFFFDGERIDQLSRHENTEEIKHAIKTIMDLEIIERAIKHTDEAQKEFLKEYKSRADSQTQVLIEKREQLEDEKDSQKELLEQLKRNKAILENQIKEVDERLIKLEKVSEKQKERSRFEEQRTSLKTKISDFDKNIASLISKQGYLALSSNLFLEIERKLDQESTSQSAIYPDLTAALITSIINQKKCICGTNLEGHHEACNELENLKKTLAPYNEYASKVRLLGENKVVKMGRKNFFMNLRRMKTEAAQFKSELFDVENRLEEISAEISSRHFEDAGSLEEKRKTLVYDSEKQVKEIGFIELNLEGIVKQLSDVDKELKKQEQREAEAKTAKNRFDLSVKLSEVLREMFNIREADVKEGLRKKLKMVYDHFLRKEYLIDLTEEYQLIVKNDSNIKVSMSQGERQITSLSFIGAIVDLAREKYNSKKENEIDEGGIYPLVMDSPFGALDSDHRRRVAHGINSLSDQIIVIVSTSQWKGEVEEEMTPFIGARYLLDYRDPKKNSTIEYEHTVIREVNKYE